MRGFPVSNTQINICWINDPQAMQYMLFCPHISDERAGIEMLTMMTVIITYVMHATS